MLYSGYCIDSSIIARYSLRNSVLSVILLKLKWNEMKSYTHTLSVCVCMILRHSMSRLTCCSTVTQECHQDRHDGTTAAASPLHQHTSQLVPLHATQSVGSTVRTKLSEQLEITAMRSDRESWSCWRNSGLWYMNHIPLHADEHWQCCSKENQQHQLHTTRHQRHTSCK